MNQIGHVQYKRGHLFRISAGMGQLARNPAMNFMADLDGSVQVR